MEESRDYRERIRAGQELAAIPDLGPVAERLVGLLLDPDDTAVTQETAEALLARGDDAGIEVVLVAAGRTEDFEQLTYLADAFTALMVERGREHVREGCEAVAARAGGDAVTGYGHLFGP